MREDCFLQRWHRPTGRIRVLVTRLETNEDMILRFATDLAVPFSKQCRRT